MTIEPIQLQQPDLKQPFDSATSLLRAENRKKAEESTSSYYVTTIQSLAASQQPDDVKPALNEIKGEKEQKSLLGRAKEWLWSLFGFGKKEPVTETEKTESDELPSPANPLPTHAPQLERPEASGERKLSKAILELNRELVSRMKDISEFEEEMRQATSHQKDKLIFFELVESSLRQRKLREDAGVLHYEDILVNQKKNKELQTKYFNLLDEINARAKTDSVLKWVNVGATVGIVSSIAIAFATAGTGALILSAMPFLTIAKGGTSLAQGVLKYKNDLTTGEIFVVGKDTKANTGKVNEHLSDLQISDEEIGQLTKTIIRHLENQSRAERAVFGRSG